MIIVATPEGVMGMTICCRGVREFPRGILEYEYAPSEDFTPQNFHRYTSLEEVLVTHPVQMANGEEPTYKDFEDAHVMSGNPKHPDYDLGYEAIEVKVLARLRMLQDTGGEQILVNETKPCPSTCH